MAIIEGTERVGDGLSSGRHLMVRARYSFATDGGAVGAITLRMEGGRTIPSGAFITGAFVQVATAPTSGGAATISVGAESATSFLGAAAISSSPWSTTGPKHMLTSSSAPVLTTAARSVTITVATAALTAGVFDVYVTYVDPAA